MMVFEKCPYDDAKLEIESQEYNNWFTNTILICSECGQIFRTLFCHNCESEAIEVKIEGKFELLL